MVQLGGVLLIRNGLLAFIIGVAFASTASAQSDLVKRGDYLVNGILTCGNCHTPKGPSGGIMDKAFSGGLSWDAPPFKVTAPNITQDKETGIGNYTDAELKQLLRKGIKRNGAPVAMIMPSGFYEIMTDRDLNAVIAYLRTIKPIKNAVPDPIYKMEQGHPIPPGGESPYTEAMLSDKVKQGFYLATIAHCMECHTPMGSRGREFANKLGAGGFEFPGPWGVSVSRNITSSKTKGIGGWTDDEIKRAVTQGVSKDGSKLNPPMGFYYYATVSAADLDAIVAYLRTVPPKE
jgi:mono/diheme cytochrome c family protein